MWAILFIVLFSASVDAATPRIISGMQAFQGGTPNIVWQAYVQVGNKACGGAIIGNLYILTAAHCVRQISGTTSTTASVDTITVSVGVSVNAAPSDVYNVYALYIDPSYTPINTFVNRRDIAILMLDRSISFNINSVNAIALASASCAACKAPGTLYIVSGYGDTVSSVATGETTPSVFLMYAQLIFVDQTTCQNQAPFTLPTGVLCATGTTATMDGRDSCLGDTGGPLAVSINGVWTLVGLVQSGTVVAGQGRPLCGAAGSSGIYADVGANRQFIDSVLGRTFGAPTATSSIVNWAGTYVSSSSACPTQCCCIQRFSAVVSPGGLTVTFSSIGSDSRCVTTIGQGASSSAMTSQTNLGLMLVSLNSNTLFLTDVTAPQCSMSLVRSLASALTGGVAAMIVALIVVLVL